MNFVIFMGVILIGNDGFIATLLLGAVLIILIGLATKWRILFLIYLTILLDYFTVTTPVIIITLATINMTAIVIAIVIVVVILIIRDPLGRIVIRFLED